MNEYEDDSWAYRYAIYITQVGSDKRYTLKGFMRGYKPINYYNGKLRFALADWVERGSHFGGEKEARDFIKNELSKYPFVKTAQVYKFDIRHTKAI